MKHLSNRIALQVLLPASLIALALGALDYSLSRSDTRLRAQADLSEAARVAAILVEHEIEEVELLGSSIITQENLENFFLFEFAGLPDDAENARLALEGGVVRLAEIHPTLRSLELFRGDGERFLAVEHGNRSLRPVIATDNSWWLAPGSVEWLATREIEGELRLTKRFSLSSGLDEIVVSLRLDMEKLVSAPLDFAIGGKSSGVLRGLDERVWYSRGINAEGPLIQASSDVKNLRARIELELAESLALAGMNQRAAQIAATQTVLFLAMIALLATSLRLTVLRPVARLMETMRAFREGVQPPAQLNASCGELAALDSALRESTLRLVEAKNELEQRVFLRTQDLERARDEALSASRAKGDFLANMSHEIRTPMNGVIGMAQILSETDLDAEQEMIVGTIRRSGDALVAVIDDILDYSKIESGRVDIEATEFELHSTVHDVADLMFESATNKGISLLCDIAPQVPTHVIGDSTRVRQVLTNLVSNAIKFTDSGTVQIRVRLARPEGDSQEDSGPPRLDFQVYDTGIGIRSDSLERIFGSFSQVDSSMTRKYGGTGLGLAISSRFVELMGGKLRVESEFGEGSQFFFNLDLPESPASERTAPTVPKTLRGTRVLVVDHSSSSRRVIVRQLSFAGLEVEEAETPVGALNKANRAAEDGRPFQFVIFDCDVPPNSQPNLVRELEPLVRSSGLRIVLLSNPKTIDSTKSMDVAGRFTKPVRPKPLLSALRSLLVENGAGSGGTTKGSATGKPECLFKGHVLLVEDNRVNQLVAKKMLANLGFEVDVANHGGEAVEQVRANVYSLVFMDCQMPVMNGFDATREILKLRPAQAVIAMTANAMASDREACAQAGMSDFVAKPVRKQDLISAIQRQLDQLRDSA